MRRKMPFSASFGLEVNTVQSSGYIKNLVDKSALSTTKPCDLWVWSANHWVKAGKRALKGWQTVQGLSGRHQKWHHTVCEGQHLQGNSGTKGRRGPGGEGQRWAGCSRPHVAWALSAVPATASSSLAALLEGQGEGLTSPTCKFRGLQPVIYTTSAVLRET